jgi:hypothetical protein
MQDASRCPEDVLGWIPWYPDDGLTHAQRGAVEAHAAACARCRDELALVGGELEVEDDPGVDAAFEGLMARVRDAERAAQVPGAAAATRRAPAPRVGRGRAAWRTHAPRVAAGLAFVMIFATAGKLIDDNFLDEPVYTTATAESSAPATEGVLLDVVFRDDVDARRIREALRSVNGQLVSGPTELGRYRVRLGAGADAQAVARALAAGDAGVAVYAEPAPR